MKINANDVRTSDKRILVGEKTIDTITGCPALLVKGKGNSYDTLTIQELVTALYGLNTKAYIVSV